MRPARSEIAAHTERLSKAMPAYHNIRFWADGLKQGQYPVSGRRITDCNWRALNQADVNVYNMGNNPDYHTGVFQCALSRPGIVILHDYYMGHFFLRLALRTTGDPDAFIRLFESQYGEQGRRAAHKLITTNSTQIDLEAGGAEIAAVGALGVIVHSKSAKHAFNGDDCPVLHLPLPFTSTRQKHTERAKNSKVNLIMCGIMGFNRRLLEVLGALSSLPERQYFHLHVFGHIPEERVVIERIAKLRLTEQVFLHGFVSDQKLSAAMARSDLAINLRFPTMGEASASQLRFWNHGLPTLVTKIGWYAEQPQDTVCFVRPDHEAEDIRRHLLEFLEHPSRYREKGINGKRHLDREHAPSRYIEGLVRFAQHCAPREINHVALELADRAAKIMSAWGPHAEPSRSFRSAAANIWRMVK